MRSRRLALLATLLALAPTAVRAQPFAYVLASDWDGATSVRVINTATRNELAKIAIPGGTSSAPAAVDLAVSPAGDRLYVVSPGPTAPRLLVIETSTNSISSSVAVGAGPAALALSADGSRIYVANGGDNTVSVVDVSTLAVLTTIPVGQGPSDIAASSDGLAVYVANSSDNTVSRIGTATNTVTGTVVVATNPIAVRLRGDGGRAYVLSDAGTSSDVLSTVDTSAMTVLSTLSLGPFTRDFAVLPDGSRAFVGSHETLNITRSLNAIDLATGTATRVPDVFPNAVLGRIGLALDASAARLFVTTGGVDAIDVNTLGRVSAIRIAEGTALEIAVTADNVPCQYEVGPLRVAFPLAGGSATGLIPAPSGCAWAIDTSATASWAHITAPASGSGPRSFTIATDPASAPRTTTVKVAGQTITIKQTVPQMYVEMAPGSTQQEPFRVTGWAIDRDDSTVCCDAGVDFIHIWAYPASGAPIFVGSTPLNSYRSDLAAIFGLRYGLSGFDFHFTGLPTGTYRVVFFAHSSRGGGFSNAFEITLSVIAARPQMVLDSPREGETYTQPFLVTGWALDANAQTGTGVDAVHVWAFPVGGGTPSFLGTAILGQLRHDLSQLYGFRFVTAGFNLGVSGLTPGAYHIVAHAHSTAAGTFNNQFLSTINVAGPAQPLFVDLYPRTVAAGSSLTLSGWALDLRSPSDDGVSVVHLWAYPVGGGAPVMFGVAPVFEYRADVSAVFGRYDSGWRVTGSLPAGAWDLVIYAFSTVTSSFDNARVIRIVSQ